MPLFSCASSPELQHCCAGIYAKDKLRPTSPPLYGGERYKHDRIRIAYVSADFRNHAVAHALCGVLEHHDRTRFAPLAFSLCKREADPIQRRLAAAFEHFTDAETLSDERIASLLREKEIDIAVDLMGYTHESRPGIFARRPAPIQVNYLGFPGTMGADFMD